MNEKKGEPKTIEVQAIEIKEEKKEEKSQPQSQTSEIAKLDSFNSVKEVMDFAKVLIASKLVPDSLNTPERLVAVIQQGKELGFGAITAINNIHNIEGKPTLSVHAIGALLRRKGVMTQTIRDFEPEYEKDRETGDLIYYKLDANKNPVKITKEEGGKPRRIDTVTTIRFMTKWEGQIITEDVTFRWSDAELQGLTTKSNWVKMPRIMTWNRCLVLGARRVAPDALLGMYEASEMADINNVIIDLDEEGNYIPKEDKNSDKK